MRDRGKRLRAPILARARFLQMERMEARQPQEERTPAAQLLLSDARTLEGECLSLRASLRRCERLPARVMALARTICEERVTRERVLRVCGGEELTQGELDRLPDALKTALIERLLLLFPALEEEIRASKAARRLSCKLSKGKKADAPGDDLTAEKALRILREREDERAVKRLARLIWEAGSVPDEMAARAHARETRTRMELESIAASLKNVSRIPWRETVFALSVVEKILMADAGFKISDDAGRARYARAVTRIAREAGKSEREIALLSLEKAEKQDGVQGEAGYYLFERPETLGGRKRLKSGSVVLACVLGTIAVASLLAALFDIPAAGFLPLCAVAGAGARRAAFRLCRRLPRRAPPRVKLKSIPDSARTLAVTPVLLCSRAQAMRLARHLAVLRYANPDANLDFLLLADFPDAKEKIMPGDEQIAQAAQESVRALGEGFYYLHRGREWDAGAGAYTGKERKRGALKMLNRLLLGISDASPVVAKSFDLSILKNRYAYVITLDADTFMPPGAARKLVGAMLHPLQKGRVAVIQPRMETPPDEVKTYAQRLLGGRGGVDFYGAPATDLWQSLTGRGTFMGKGIYDPALFYARTEGLPKGKILSHDLIEGEMAVCALACDIPFYDGHPRTLAGFMRREHRWTRGDWQLIPFLFDRSLSALSKYKIYDNLRRSLLPLMQTLLLFVGAAAGNVYALLLALILPYQGGAGSYLARLSLLPMTAYNQSDAAARALYRRFVSQKKLLEWTPAAQAEGESGLVPGFVSALCGGVMLALGARAGSVLSLCVGALWALTPILSPILNRPVERPYRLPPNLKKELLDTCARTFRFFEDTVTKERRFLPPDNLQISPDRGAAERVSPTNIGLYMLSCAAARKLKLISGGEMLKRLRDTAGTLEAMEKWNGHLYNWYGCADLSPLKPRFVSTVDSGNLAACLAACAQAARQEKSAEYAFLPARLDRLWKEMRFDLLYDPDDRLLAVGFDAKEGKLTGARYDLLASEARTASLIGILRGQLPLRHWRALGRPSARAGGGAALLSWAGTMFEYLMPNILTPPVRGTLLHGACMRAIKAQRRPFRPYGVSESGYYAFDAQLNYQYRAFGMQKLALSRVSARTLSPYACALSLPLAPRAALKSLQRFKRLGLYGDYGYYESFDLTARRIVKSYMAHHQGMLLCAACNLLTDGALGKLFTELPAVKAYSLLLMEPALTRAPRVSGREIRDKEQGEQSFRMRAEGIETHLLYGAGTTLALSANGAGAMTRQNILLARPDAKTGRSLSIYLIDGASGERLPPFVDAVFETGRARYSMKSGAFGASLTCYVGPLDGAVYYLIEMENRDRRAREIQLISYLAVALGKKEDDEAHPQFRNLSVEVTREGEYGLCARRRSRGDGEKTPILHHALLSRRPPDAFSCQGDRALFLGRGGSADDPAEARLSMEDALRRGRYGAVIDPCMSLRAQYTLEGGGRASAVFAVWTGEEDGNTYQSALSALPLASARARVTEKYLSLSRREWSDCARLLGLALFGSAPGGERIEDLWALGLGLEWPLLAAEVRSQAQERSARLLLKAQAAWRMMGLKTDVALLLDGEDGYGRPLRSSVRDAALSLSGREGERGGFYILSLDNAVTVRAFARVYLAGDEPARAQCALPKPREEMKNLTGRTEPMELTPPQFYNGLGGFTREGAYQLCLPEDKMRDAPAPWCNLLCNERFGTLCSEQGLLYSYLDNSRLSRFTRFCNDATLTLPSEEFYFIFEGRACSLTPRPTLSSAFLVTVEPGAQTYETEIAGISCELCCYADRERPIGFRVLTLRSRRINEIRLTLRYVALFEKEGAQARAIENACILLPHRFYQTMEGGSARIREGMTGEIDREILLPAGQSLRVSMALGCGEPADANDISGGVREVRAQWQEKLSRLRLFSPDARLCLMLNVWLPYQTRASRLMAKAGFYQPGGAIGFRDQLQDMTLLLYTEPEAARAHLLLCAARQFEEGDVLHWWHPERTGVRTRVSDDLLFLPYMTAKYVRVTGDEGVLNERVSFLSAPELKEGERDRYFTPDLSDETATLREHCLRAIRRVQYGARGLPLMGGGDWNDGMNHVRGESVWLCFFLICVLRDFAPLCKKEEAEELTSLRLQLSRSAEQAWDGRWYLRAWYEDGRTLGGENSDVPRIDLVSQCWAALAGAPPDRARKALNAAWERLFDEQTGILRLLDPPFTQGEGAGYIEGYLPGVRENGGQYTHAVAWMISALVRAGEYDRAWRLVDAALPVERASTPEGIMRYKTEPYFTAADIYSRGDNRGRGGWTMYTGSAALVYEAILCDLLGFEKRGNRARLRPKAPSWGLAEYTLLYKFGSSVYHFTAAEGLPFPTLDGEKLDGGWVTLLADGRTREARFPLNS